MTSLSFIVFLLIFASVYLGMHYYVYFRIVTGLMLAPAFIPWLRVLFVIGGVSFFAGEVASRNSTALWARIAVDIGAIWLGILSIAVSVFVLRDILSIFFRTDGFRYYSTVASLVLLGCMSGVSLINVARGYITTEIRVPVASLPAELSPFTIAQISDLHLNYTISPDRVQKLVADANSMDPDIIVITGDLIDAEICRLEQVCQALKSLKAKYGVYAITGNHEFYAGLPSFLRIAQRTGMKVLREENVTIADGIILAGIDDPEAYRFEKTRPSIEKALNNPPPAKPGMPVILLSHRPEFFDQARHLGVSLQLSGHTHAGQIPPLDLIVKLFLRYSVGLHQRGDSVIYTTTGTGYWGPPMRLFSRSEIVKIVVAKAVVSGKHNQLKATARQ